MQDRNNPQDNLCMEVVYCVISYFRISVYVSCYHEIQSVYSNYFSYTYLCNDFLYSISSNIIADNIE